MSQNRRAGGRCRFRHQLMKAVGQKLIRQMSLRAEVIVLHSKPEPKPSVVAVRVTNAGDVTQKTPERRRETRDPSRSLRYTASTGSWSWASLELSPAFEKTSMPKAQTVKWTQAWTVHWCRQASVQVKSEPARRRTESACLARHQTASTVKLRCPLS